MGQVTVRGDRSKEIPNPISLPFREGTLKEWAGYSLGRLPHSRDSLDRNDRKRVRSLWNAPYEVVKNT